MSTSSPAVSDIATQATTGMAQRVGDQISQAIAKNPQVAAAIGGAMLVIGAGAAAYYGGRWTLDTTRAGVSWLRNRLRSAEPIEAATPAADLA